MVVNYNGSLALSFIDSGVSISIANLLPSVNSKLIYTSQVERLPG